MATLQDEQPPFDRAVCDAMVASSPDDWTVIVLTLERPVGVTQAGQLEHCVSSPDHRRPVTPDDSLYEATRRLDELFRRHGGLFRRAVYRVELSPDSWRYTAEFGYDDSPPAERRTPNRGGQPAPGASSGKGAVE